MTKPTVVLITTVWQRHALTAVFWRWTAYLREWWQDAADLRLACAGSDDPEHERLAEEAGAVYVDVPNTPLGHKWNMALKLGRGLKADAVLVMGSDDMFCEATASAYLPHLADGQYAGLADCYYLQTVDGRLGYFPGYTKPERRGEPCGSGRLIPVQYLKALGWELWSPKPWFKDHPGYRPELQNHGVDHASFKRMALVAPSCPLITLRDIPGTMLACKGQGNLWQFEHTHPFPIPKTETPESVVYRLPADIVASLRAFRQVEVAA